MQDELSLRFQWDQIYQVLSYSSLNYLLSCQSLTWCNSYSVRNEFLFYIIMVQLTNVLFDLACKTSFYLTQVLIKVYLTTWLDDNSSFLACESSFDLTEVLIMVHLTSVLFNMACITRFDLTHALIMMHLTTVLFWPGLRNKLLSYLSLNQGSSYNSLNWQEFLLVLWN